MAEMSDMLLTIGRLAARAKVNPKTIRFYEQIGLMRQPLRTEAGYRAYSDDAFERFSFIRKAQGLGLSLEEVKQILSLVDRGKSPCTYVRRLLLLNLREIKEKLSNFKDMRQRITKTLKTPCSSWRRNGRRQEICLQIERQPTYPPLNLFQIQRPRCWKQKSKKRQILELQH